MVRGLQIPVAFFIACNRSTSTPKVKTKAAICDAIDDFLNVLQNDNETETAYGAGLNDSA